MRALLLALAMIAACASPTAISSRRTWFAIWNPQLGYARDLCAFGAFSASQAEAVVFPSRQAALDALRAADMDPRDFELREVP